MRDFTTSKPNCNRTAVIIYKALPFLLLLICFFFLLSENYYAQQTDPAATPNESSERVRHAQRARTPASHPAAPQPTFDPSRLPQVETAPRTAPITGVEHKEVPHTPMPMPTEAAPPLPSDVDHREVPHTPVPMPLETQPAPIPIEEPVTDTAPTPKPEAEHREVPLTSVPMQVEPDESLTSPDDFPSGPEVERQPLPSPGPQQTQEAPSESGGQAASAVMPVLLQAFYVLTLILMGVLLVNFYHRNNLLNTRLYRLELLMEKTGEITPIKEELTPFSWEKTIRSLEEGWVILSPEYRIHEPGLVGIEVGSYETGHKVSANIIKNIVENQDMGVIYLSKDFSEENLAETLLAMEEGISQDSPSQKKIDKDVIPQLRSYEKNLFILRDLTITVDDLYLRILKLSADNKIGMVVIDGINVIETKKDQDLEALLAVLRLVAVKTYIPIIVIDTFSKMVISPVTSAFDLFTAFAEMKESIQDNETSIVFVKNKGDTSLPVFSVDESTGRVVMKEAVNKTAPSEKNSED